MTTKNKALAFSLILGALSTSACGVRTHTTDVSPTVSRAATCDEAIDVYTSRAAVPHDYYELAWISAEGNSVYTSDNKLHLYEINQVRRHQRSLDQALNARSDQLWLQTSEGPNSSYPKLMVVAKPLSTGPASYGDSHPKARPVDCG